MVRSTCRLIEMRNIRKVYHVTFTHGKGEDEIPMSEVYEQLFNASERMSVLLNSLTYFNVKCDEVYEVGLNLGLVDGTLVSSLENAERMAEHKYGEAHHLW